MKSTVRLQHFLSLTGVTGRRKAPLLIKKGHVRVNSQKILDPFYQVFPQKDQVYLKGKLLKIPTQKWYIALNKPPKVLTSLKDPKGRPLVSDYFPKIKDRLFPIGRLDWSAEGLLLMTNDGDFAHQVLKQKPPKTYMLKLNHPPSQAQLLRLKKGVRTEIGFLKACYVDCYRNRSLKWVKVIIAEGKNRQLHRMFEKVGLSIRVLRRVAIGKLKIRSLRPGEYVYLSPQDIKKVFLTPKELK